MPLWLDAIEGDSMRAMYPTAPHAADVIASGIHDAKNSMFDALARIYLAMQSIQDGHATEALPVLIETERAISASADRLSKLLSAYRLTRHENPVSMVPVELAGFIDDVLVRVRQSVEIGIDITVQRQGPDIWIFDRELIADCLVNAVQNALRHARHQIRVRINEDREWLSFSVADDGPGFPDPLPSRADGTHSGVGLFIARRVARLHQRHNLHGELLLGNDSELRGADFQLRLP